MKEGGQKVKTKKLYVSPKILASYAKEKLEEIVKHSVLTANNVSGCGCGSGINPDQENGLDGLP